MGYSFEKEHGLYILDTPETVVADGKTLMISSIAFSSTKTGGGHLILTDIDGNVFADFWGQKNHVAVLPFPKPIKVNGLIVATIDTGKACLYLAQP